jgi:hypothetical protein
MTDNPWKPHIPLQDNVPMPMDYWHKVIETLWHNPAVFNSRVSGTTAEDLDDFPTPPWATRALMAALDRWPHFMPSELVALEPACGRGHMQRTLAEYFRHAAGFDICDYGQGYDVRDFLSCVPLRYDWGITNPPFKLASAFIARMLQEARVGVAIFVRTNFLEGQGRYNELYSLHKPTLILQFTERVVLHEHELRDPDQLYQLPDGTWKKPSTATSYCWIVWLVKNKPRQSNFDWIAPCRLSLTKPFDYATLTPK